MLNRGAAEHESPVRRKRGVSVIRTGKRVSPPKRSGIPVPRVGNRGEYLCYCHCGDVLSASQHTA